MAKVTQAQRVSTSRRGAARGIVIDGADVVASAFTSAASEIRAKTSSVVVEFAGLAEDKMYQHTNSRRVAESLTADSAATDTPTSVYAEAGPDPRVSNQAFIARFLEYGTPRHPPQPFAMPAADELAGPFGEAIAKLL